ncbi:tyrosine-type recombinase/integrase [Peribacillus glennii]|uniref:Integrase n=1 Tax=Peribacillus glennii TaxID=2303991 RepID=A0A372L817_9BACI|nr:tyrosine-type recombinase/integrase [Peribacillus glennii]RFU60971.1 hypothetical protein D0466_19780 [Peribacillus glennii]
MRFFSFFRLVRSTPARLNVVQKTEGHNDVARGYISERGGVRRATATAKGRRLPVEQPSARYTIDEALDIFVKAKEAEGVRPRTVENYRQHVSYLRAFLGEGFNIDELTPEVIRDYIIYLRVERPRYEGSEGRKFTKVGLSVNTINMRLRTLKTMCTFWHAEGMTPTNAMKTVKPVKDDSGEEVPGLTDAEVDKILGYFDEKQFAEWRDKTLVLLLLDTGLRINEAVSLTIEQVDVKRGELFIPSEIAKNRKGRDVPVSREIAKRLVQLHEESRQYFGSNDDIFMNAYGEPFTAEAFRRRLYRIKKRLGMPRLHPHMFRHTFCRNYILNGGDIYASENRRLRGHKDNTQIHSDGQRACAC